MFVRLLCLSLLISVRAAENGMFKVMIHYIEKQNFICRKKVNGYSGRFHS